MKPPAIVMNMFYTGLGIARSLGDQGIPVVGLTAQHRIYGNFTRYARIAFSPDSRTAPDELAEYLVGLGKTLGSRAVIYPTRDDDLLFLDRFREKLAPYFSAVMPESAVLRACLDKWETYGWARRAGVSTPACWLVEGIGSLDSIAGEVRYPCVLKPVSASAWRQSRNWELVGGRKAIALFSREDLLREYEAVSKASPQALVQEMIPGDDRCLVIAACYFDRKSNFVAGFNTQKLLQLPEGFGTGCIVQSVDRPELFEPTIRLLQAMSYSGIAEVEYKWNAERGEHQLIEINPRPWDQHRLGKTCGTDLAFIAYCDHAGVPAPPLQKRGPSYKWIADDGFMLAAAQALLARNGKIRSIVQLARGRRIYGIWSAKDPLPFVAYMAGRFLPEMLVASVRAIGKWIRPRSARPARDQQKKANRGFAYENRFGKGKNGA